MSVCVSVCTRTYIYLFTYLSTYQYLNRSVSLLSEHTIEQRNRVSSYVKLPFIFRYKHCPGNNGRLILSNFRKRPWWQSGAQDKRIKAKKEKPPEDQREGAPTTLWDMSTKLSNEDLGWVRPKTARTVNMVWEMSRNPKRYASYDYISVVLNHLENNQWLVSKKKMYFAIREYYKSIGKDVLDIIPRTFYLSSYVGGSDKTEECELEAFKRYNLSYPDRTQRAIGIENSKEGVNGCSPDCESQPIWIVKPGSFANRGFGIQVVRGYDAALRVVEGVVPDPTSAETSSVGAEKDEVEQYEASPCKGDKCKPQPGADCNELTKRASALARSYGWIAQEYISHPMLIMGRKFDIRCFVLLVNSTMDGLKAYWYRDGYIRLSCKRYSLSRLSDRETHLTNDAVQKGSKLYKDVVSKLSYAEWQESINKEYPTVSADIVEQRIIPKIREQAEIAILAAMEKGLATTKIHRSFELLGYDFMVDSDFNPFLIEINTNPCLEFTCPLLERIIGTLVDNVWKIVIDDWFPPPPEHARTKYTEEAIIRIENEPNLFELLYDSKKTSISNC